MADNLSQSEPFIWVSDIIEYLYCPRFIYYERVLNIPQFQELRTKVKIGRDIHEKKAITMGSYLRKRIGVKKKLTNIKIVSEKLHLVGILDELLFFDDGTIGPLDYKFAQWEGVVHKPLYYQSMAYGVLAQDLFNQPSNRGYIVYTRSSNHMERINFPPNKKERIENIVNNVMDIIFRCAYPNAKTSSKQCGDCTYRKICLK